MEGVSVSGSRMCRRALAAAVGVVLAVPAAAHAGPPPPPPIDPQHVQDQQDMTFSDYHPIPGVDWATSGATPSVRPVTKRDSRATMSMSSL